MDIKEYGIKNILEEYLPSIPLEMRDQAMAALMKASAIEQAFSTPGGKQVLEGAATVIATSVGKIIEISREGGDIEKLKWEANRIRTVLELMSQWALVYSRGKDIVTKAEKIKKARR